MRNIHTHPGLHVIEHGGGLIRIRQSLNLLFAGRFESCSAESDVEKNIAAIDFLIEHGEDPQRRLSQLHLSR